MNELSLTVATSEYDHVRDLADGRVSAEGIDLRYQLIEAVEEIFFRFTKFREWDASEMSFGKYVALTAAGDSGLTAIPVFPSRMFRQSAIFVRSGSDLHDPAALAGKTVGIPEWAQTAGIYVRGWLMNQLGIDLASIDWVQAGVSQPGRVEKEALHLPKGVRITAAPTRTLGDLLAAGEIDAAITAHPPPQYEAGSGEIRMLIDNPRAAEEAYFKATRVFPIMHVLALKRAVHDSHPWAAMNLLTAFEESRRRAVRRALDRTASRVPVPFACDDAKVTEALFGSDPFAYGMEPNRTTLEAFLGFAFEQGVCARRLEVEELFPREVHSVFKV